MDGNIHATPAWRHLLHGYCLSHFTFRCAQIAQLRPFSIVLGAVVRGDVGSLDAVVVSASFRGLGADIDPIAAIINESVMVVMSTSHGDDRRDGLGTASGCLPRIRPELILRDVLRSVITTSPLKRSSSVQDDDGRL